MSIPLSITTCYQGNLPCPIWVVYQNVSVSSQSFHKGTVCFLRNSFLTLVLLSSHLIVTRKMFGGGQCKKTACICSTKSCFSSAKYKKCLKLVLLAHLSVWIESSFVFQHCFIMFQLHPSILFLGLLRTEHGLNSHNRSFNTFFSLFPTGLEEILLRIV